MNGNSLQKKMIAHGALILLIGMFAGIGLLISVLGGLELIPGKIIDLSIPGNPGAWARTHLGGMLNGILVIIVALLIPVLAFTEKAAKNLFWMLVGTGYANTLFYWAALIAPNRAISFADNKYGPANLASIIGLTPALIFALVSIVAIFMVMRQAFSAASR